MTITVHTIANQDAVARRLIQGSEGHNLTTPTNVGDHTITSGFGYTFIRRGAQNLWGTVGTLVPDLASVGVTLTGVQINQLTAIATQLNASNNTQADTLITQFSAGWTAAPLTEAQAETLFTRELEVKKTSIQTRFRSILQTTNGNALYAALDGTREMAGLLSLSYNAESLIGTGLVNALWNGDRAEAWFQIRYASNGGQDRPGLAKRRFAEAQYIGLYAEPSNATLAESQSAFKALQKHRPAIFAYEAEFGLPPNGSDPSGGNRIATANSDLGAALTFAGIGNVPTIVEALSLYGGAGNDTIWGDESNAAMGGEYNGNNYLDGEDGNDEGQPQTGLRNTTASRRHKIDCAAIAMNFIAACAHPIYVKGQFNVSICAMNGMTWELVA